MDRNASYRQGRLDTDAVAPKRSLFLTIPFFPVRTLQQAFSAAFRGKTSALQVKTHMHEHKTQPFSPVSEETGS